jgi:hypothetical protein
VNGIDLFIVEEPGKKEDENPYNSLDGKGLLHEDLI